MLMGPSWSARPAGARADGARTLANGLAARAYSQSARAPRPGPAVISASVPRGTAPTGPGAAASTSAHSSIPASSPTAARCAQQQPSVVPLLLGGPSAPVRTRVPRVPVLQAPLGAARKLPESARAGGGSGARMGARVGSGGAHGR